MLEKKLNIILRIGGGGGGKCFHDLKLNVFAIIFYSFPTYTNFNTNLRNENFIILVIIVLGVTYLFSIYTLVFTFVDMFWKESRA